MDHVAGTEAGRALDEARVTIRGWVRVSATTSPLTRGDDLGARSYDGLAEGFRLHQAYLSVERAASETIALDAGWKVAVLYGADARGTHARGLLDDQGDTEEQFDLLEAYLRFHDSIGHGLDLKVGKCTTPLGFEAIEDGSDSLLLLSRSFLFGYALPSTHTGAIATLCPTEAVTLTYGLVLGWDVVDDANDALTHVAGVSWTSASQRDTVSVTGIVGAERPDDDRHLRTVVDATWTREVSACWKTVLNADVGFDEGAAADGGDAAWWGLAAYASWKASDVLTASGRVEYFEDADGTRLGERARLFEATLGLDWTPWRRLPNVRVRPEVRWDHSLDGGYFDGGTDEDQVSLALSLLVTF